MKSVIALSMLALTFGLPAAGQSWDNSGNGMLQGTYYFRHVIWEVGYNDGSFDYAAAIYGNISFDGNGNYTITKQQALDSNQGLGSFSTTGTYSISASGYGFMGNPFVSGDSLYGLVAHGIFVASSTDNQNGYNDLLIAAPLPSPLPATSFFSGSYTLYQIEFPSGTPSDTRGIQASFNADGNGGVGSVRASAHIPANGTSAVTQTISNVKYRFSNGAAVLSFGSTLNSQLLAGDEYLYFSPDGNFFFGGAPDDFDMIVGVRNGGSTPNFSDLYYQAGVYQDYSTASALGYSDFDTQYGSFKASGGTLLAHQRLLSAFNGVSDYTYSNTYTLNSDGSLDDSANHYVFGSGGTYRIGIGNLTSAAPRLGISVAVQVPPFSPSGVFIDPTGVVNAASSALFTAGIAPGELITIYGSNLSPVTLADATFPTLLGGVQVTVNDVPAPIYVVSPTQISAVVPFSTTQTVGNIKVINSGTSSNVVSSYVNMTSPGVFTKPEGGVGTAAALHSDYSLVSAASPAQIGETVSIYVTGLGGVTPAVGDGTPGPTNPLSTTTSTFTVLIGGVSATTSFVGLAPQLVGLYQINVTVPAGVAAGNALVEIAGPDSTTFQATLPVGTASSASTVAPVPAALPTLSQHHAQSRRR